MSLGVAIVVVFGSSFLIGLIVGRLIP